MSPPEIWGPPIWTFFHVMAEKIIEEKFTEASPQVFMWMKRICHFLPCPECSTHATAFLGKIKPVDIDTKQKFIGMVYLFHNAVNARKRKPLFNFANINKYKKISIISAFQGFLKVYNTKGNMKLLTESFQRDIVIRDIHKWMRFNLHFFLNNSETLNDDNSSSESQNGDQNKEPNLPFDENSLMISLTQPDIPLQYPTQTQFSMNLHRQNRFQLYHSLQNYPMDNVHNHLNYYANQQSNSIYNYNLQNNGDNSINGIKYSYIQTPFYQNINNTNQAIVEITENSNENASVNDKNNAKENINFKISENNAETNNDVTNETKTKSLPTENNDVMNSNEYNKNTIIETELKINNEIIQMKQEKEEPIIAKNNMSPLDKMNNVSNIQSKNNNAIKVQQNTIVNKVEKTNDLNNHKVNVLEKELEKVNTIEKMIIKLSHDFDIVKKETENIQNVETIVEKAVDKALEKAMTKVVEKTIEATMGKNNDFSNSQMIENNNNHPNFQPNMNNGKRNIQHVKKTKK